jgi:hypothetical protein
MKHFREYLNESAKKYDFKVKIAGEFTTEQEKLLQVFLEKYKISDFKKSGKTPIQELPLDFPKIKNSEVNIYEVTLDYPTTQFELTEYISGNLNIAKENLAVRRSGEPYEEYQTPTEKRTGALLDDKDYSEAPNAKFEDYYGDSYNMNFVKELNAELKANREARGEKIPTDGPAKFNTDAACYHKSPVQQAADPRK